MNTDRAPIAIGQLALSGSLLAFALLIYLVCLGGPSQYLAEVCVLAFGFGAFKTRRFEPLETVRNVAVDHQPVSTPQFPTLHLRKLQASLKPVDLAVPMQRIVVVSVPPAAALTTNQQAVPKLSEMLPTETTISAEPPTETVFGDELPAEIVPVGSPSFETRLWMQEVREIARRYKNKFKFKLSPLVYGPETEVLPIINACLPAGSLCDVTVRCREIIMLGRAQYALVQSACSQKKFVGNVMAAHNSLRRAGGLTSPDVSFATCCDTLTGKSSVLVGRLRQPMPSKEDLQLALL